MYYFIEFETLEYDLI